MRPPTSVTTGQQLCDSSADEVTSQHGHLHLLSLPQKLRDAIYEHVLRPATVSHSYDAFEHDLLPINNLKDVCRQLRRELEDKHHARLYTLALQRFWIPSKMEVVPSAARFAPKTLTLYKALDLHCCRTYKQVHLHVVYKPELYPPVPGGSDCIDLKLDAVDRKFGYAEKLAEFHRSGKKA